jgi:D-glycero-alpha-D-manno-heptose-7-phosphate kinase
VIIARAPLRVSLFGGGSDYESFFSKKYGSVLGGSISKYVYISLSDLPPFSPEKFRLTYRKTESVDSIPSIEHPVVREVLLDLDIKSGLNMATMSDISGGSGLGGSSAFTVALKASLDRYRGIAIDPISLANYAIKIERGKLGEYGGWQDQFHCSIGGFREYRFSSAETSYSRPLLGEETLKTLSKCFFLYSVGESRYSSEMAAETHATFSRQDGIQNLEKLAELSSHTAIRLSQTKDISHLYELISHGLNSAWELKRNFGSKVAPEYIENEISKGLKAGASAAKLCGAGGAGFILFMVPEKSALTCRLAMGYDKTVDFTFVPHGVQTWELGEGESSWI